MWEEEKVASKDGAGRRAFFFFPCARAPTVRVGSLTVGGCPGPFFTGDTGQEVPKQGLGRWQRGAAAPGKGRKTRRAKAGRGCV